MAGQYDGYYDPNAAYYQHSLPTDEKYRAAPSTSMHHAGYDGVGGSGDNEYAANFMAQSSIYTPQAVASRGGPDRTAAVGAKGKGEKHVTVVRKGGGQVWEDPTLLEWDPAHFRLFIGDLAGEVNDGTLIKAFSHYPSLQKAKVVRDKKTTKSKGFGFVSFASTEDYMRASKEMNGKFIGTRPIKLRKAHTPVQAVAVKSNPKALEKVVGGKEGSGRMGKVEIKKSALVKDPNSKKAPVVSISAPPERKPATSTAASASHTKKPYLRVLG